jgi:hypothetical protein
MGTGRRDQQIHPKTFQKLARRVVLGVQVGKLWRFRATEWTISSWVASATIHSIPARFDKLPRLSRRRDGDGAEPLARAAAAEACGLRGQVCTAVAGKSGYPMGLREAFDLFAKWQPYVKPGNWWREICCRAGSSDRIVDGASKTLTRD